MGKKVERDAAVKKSRLAGASFAEIARQYGLSSQRVRQIIRRKDRDEDYLRDSPFKPLGLSKTSLNALAYSQFETIEQVAAASDEDILRIPRVGKDRLLEIRKALVNWGASWAGSEGRVSDKAVTTKSNLRGHQLCAPSGKRLEEG